jgi:hypothetical protein
VKFIIVADKDLVRLAGRVEAVMSEEMQTETWTFDELQRRRDEIEPTTGVVVIGEGLMERLGAERIKVEHREDGLCWGRIGKAVTVWVEPSDTNPMIRGTAVEQRLSSLKAEAKRRRRAAEEAGHARLSGARMSHRFIRREHDHDPRETVQINDGAAFSLERMIWEKEYTAAVAWFLLDGFPRYQLDTMRASTKAVLDRLQ